MKFTSTSLGFCLIGDSKQVPQQLFLHHFRNQRVITVYILPENLFTASYINLRQSLHWHRRKNNVKEPCAETLLSSYYNHSKDLQLMFVLFLCAYQFDCQWLCPWLSIPAILAIYSCFFWCFHINNSNHNQFTQNLTFLLQIFTSCGSFTLWSSCWKQNYSICKFWGNLTCTEPRDGWPCWGRGMPQSHNHHLNNKGRCCINSFLSWSVSTKGQHRTDCILEQPRSTTNSVLSVQKTG